MFNKQAHLRLRVDPSDRRHALARGYLLVKAVYNPIEPVRPSWTHSAFGLFVVTEGFVVTSVEIGFTMQNKFLYYQQ